MTDDRDDPAWLSGLAIVLVLGWFFCALRLIP